MPQTKAYVISLKKQQTRTFHIKSKGSGLNTLSLLFKEELDENRDCIKMLFLLTTTYCKPIRDL